MGLAAALSGAQSQRERQTDRYVNILSSFLLLTQMYTQILNTKKCYKESTAG